MKGLNYSKINIIGILALIILMLPGCSEEIKMGGIFGVRHCIRFTDNPNFNENVPETIIVDANEQTITLEIKSMTYDDCEFPSELDFGITEWDESTDSWNEGTFPSDTNQEDDFYYVWTDKIDGMPVIKVRLKSNDSFEERKLRLFITSDARYYNTIPVGEVTIIQSGYNDDSNKSDSLQMVKAFYKGRLYSSEVAISPEGDISYLDPEFSDLMQKIDTIQSINMVIMGDEQVYYYDAEDISENRPLEDIRNASDLNSKNASIISTRGEVYPFDGLAKEDLGFFAIYDNDNFGGSRIAKGLTNFHFTHNLSALKPYSMNDKVTSIAVYYAAFESNVCSVLTVWDDSDFNFGDKDRKKHRISIIATWNSRRTLLPALKKIKKIGSSKSWNDCISSISFHFGYPDSLLLDY